MGDELFSLYSPGSKKFYLLLTGLIALITPFTDTCFLPALPDIKNDLRTDEIKVSLTVSIYLAAVAVGQLTFGPVSDYVGRKRVILYGLLAFEIFTIGCVFSPTIDTLIALRAVEGFLCAASLISAQAVIADVYEPAERGVAAGLFFTPLLIGPILAPLLGGFLSSAFGWRSTFVLLAVMTVPIALLVWAFLPETHPYYVVRQLGVELDLAGDKDSLGSGIEDAGETWIEAVAVQLPADLQGEAGAGEQQPGGTSLAFKRLIYAKYKKQGLSDLSTLLPPIVMPWNALEYLFDLQLLPYFANVCLSFTAMFTSLAILPLYFALPPWNLSQGEVGLTYIPSGLAMLLGSIWGGQVSDYSARTFPHSPDGRLTLMLVPLWVIPFGTVAFAYTLQYKANLAAVLVTQCVFVGCQAAMMPGTLSYLSTMRPLNAGTVASVLLFLCFAGSAVSVSLCVIISDAIGIGLFFVILSALNFASIAATTACNLHRIQAPPVLDDKIEKKTMI